MNRHAGTTVTAAVVQSMVVLAISSAALAMISPAVTGCNPACAALRHAASLNRYQTSETRYVSTEDGPAIAPVVTNAPQNPPTRHPTRLTTIMFGPGAAWANANSAANCCAVIQWCTSTTWRCISGITPLAPPNASSESCA